MRSTWRHDKVLVSLTAKHCQKKHFQQNSKDNFRLLWRFAFIKLAIIALSLATRHFGLINLHLGGCVHLEDLYPYCVLQRPFAVWAFLCALWTLAARLAFLFLFPAVFAVALCFLGVFPLGLCDFASALRALGLWAFLARFRGRSWALVGLVAGLLCLRSAFGFRDLRCLACTGFVSVCFRFLYKKNFTKDYFICWQE